MALTWLNEPPQWSYLDGTLTLETGNETDFWRTTHYGFIRDDGHVFGREVTGDFVVSIRFRGDYETLYDQAGLMVRLDERNWIKAGIEYVEGVANLSAVVTREVSDWSVIPLQGVPPEVWLRMRRSGDTVTIEAALDGETYRMIRLAYLEPGRPAFVGPMACSPKRAGFRATFDDFRVEEGTDA